MSKIKQTNINGYESNNTNDKVKRDFFYHKLPLMTNFRIIMIFMLASNCLQMTQKNPKCTNLMVETECYHKKSGKINDLKAKRFLFPPQLNLDNFSVPTCDKIHKNFHDFSRQVPPHNFDVRKKSLSETSDSKFNNHVYNDITIEQNCPLSLYYMVDRIDINDSITKRVMGFLVGLADGAEDESGNYTLSGADSEWIDASHFYSLK